MEKVVAMYDVRGIQKYIYKRKKIKDAMGASAMVENIIIDALRAVVKKQNLLEESNLEWCVYDENNNPKEPRIYKENSGKKIEVLFIGGGNAVVAFESRQCCIEINKMMSKYIIEQTYSLQLAVAIQQKTSSYSEDYNGLQKQMSEIKAKMEASKPLAALPIMRAEYETGYPIVKDDISTETRLKQEYKERNTKLEEDSKILDNLTTQKGVDSILAVVHIDGNNMGLRIRELIENVEDYETAVNRMRNISFNICFSYQKVFDKMYEQVEQMSSELQERMKKDKKYFIRKILVAGDDITYVCNGKIALATVEYFCKEISKCVMYKRDELNPEQNYKEYGFSVCAGIAYMGSHFPFSIAYDTAEECCDNAKKRAKAEVNRDGERIGNYVDFQICKNVQCRNLSRIRNREYETPYGEKLCIRPYYICTDKEDSFKTENKLYSLSKLKRDILFFQNEAKGEGAKEQNIPRSFAKKMRNLYSGGENQLQVFVNFLESRNYCMPDGTLEIFREMEIGKTDRKVKVALWYDALEMLDLYENLDDKWGEEK